MVKKKKTTLEQRKRNQRLRLCPRQYQQDWQTKKEKEWDRDCDLHFKGHWFQWTSTTSHWWTVITGWGRKWEQGVVGDDGMERRMREKTIAISGRSKAQKEREAHERKTSKWKKKTAWKGKTQKFDLKNRGDIDRESLSMCVKNSEIKKLSNIMEPWPTTMRESERCWHAVSSRLLPWCLWSAACQWQDLVKCNSSRLRTHVCRKRQQIQIFPLYCHNAYFFFCQSVCLSVNVGFVSVRLSVSLFVSFCLASFTAPLLPKRVPSFISGRWLTALCWMTYDVWFIVLRQGVLPGQSDLALLQDCL